MPGITHAGKYQGPSEKASLPAAWFFPTMKIELFRSAPINFDFSTNQTKTKVPVVRQILLLFGKGDETSSGVEGDFLTGAKCKTRYCYEPVPQPI